jgi:hypothetical protein
MAKVVSLVYQEQKVAVLGKLLVQHCGLEMENSTCDASPYNVKSKVSQSDFRTFVSALEDTSVPITKDNFGGLFRLCDEFHSGEL